MRPLPAVNRELASRVFADGAVVLAGHVGRAVAIVVARIEAHAVLAEHALGAVTIVAAVGGAHASAAVRLLAAAEQGIGTIAIVACFRRASACGSSLMSHSVRPLQTQLDPDSHACCRA